MESAIKSIIANALKNLETKHKYVADQLTTDLFAIIFSTTPPVVDAPAPEAPAETEDAKALKKKESAAKAAATRAANKKKKEDVGSNAAAAPIALPPAPLNLAKMTKTHEKHLKAGLDGAHREMNEAVQKQFLDFLNALTPDDFKKKKMPEHVTDFMRPPVDAPAAAPAPDEVGRIVFKGKVYWVGKVSKKVFRSEDDEEDADAATVRAHVGYWNMNEFKSMDWDKVEWAEESE
jgi:hypothetical protein